MIRPSELRMRRMTRDDLDAAMEIESASHPNAWPRKVFWRWLRDPQVHGTILDIGGEVCGFYLLSFESGKCHLINIAIAPLHRRQGYARLAIGHIEEFCMREGMSEIYLEVRESNLPAQLLYKSCSFEAVDILRDHYGSEDGYRMQKSLLLE